MSRERDIETGVAVALAMAVLPMNWIAYWGLSIALMVLAARVIWLTVRPAHVRLTASIAVVILLSLILVPEMMSRLGH
jgi:hypothetical protein